MVWTNTHKQTTLEYISRHFMSVFDIFSTLKPGTRQSTLRWIVQPSVVDAVIITVQAVGSIISAEQREKPDQATHAVMTAQNHSKNLI